MATTTISFSEVKRIVNYAIDNNLKLEEEGKVPIAIGLEASAGIGKTSILEQIAEERGMKCTKISLHEMEEAGDILGYPQIEYECQIAKLNKDKDGKVIRTIMPGTVWLNSKQIDNKENNIAIRQTGKTRMGYAKPAWVPEYCDGGNLVILDDYVRANPQLLQACMELILTQKYTSWKLPKKTTICLTNNPDDGTNNVNSLDEAQKTRFVNYEVGLDINTWAEWAEKNKLDGRCINFALSYAGELFNADEEGNRICNPRSYVMFANMISGIKNWDDADSLEFINVIAKGCFKDKTGSFSKMFSAFIRNKMHELIQPKEMLNGDWGATRQKLFDTVYDSTGQYRPDIASLLARRFASYVNAWLDSDEKTPISKVKERLIDFIDCEEKFGRKIFTKDPLYNMLKKITSEHKAQTNKLMYEPKIASILA